MRNERTVVSVCAFVFLSLVVLAGGKAWSAAEYRGLWVDAFAKGFHTAKEVDDLVDTARKYNYNALFVEVRKMCDAYYNSNVEPKAVDVEPQSFDPLGYMIQKAHDTSDGKQRLEVHAWLVTYRANIKGARVPQGTPKHILLTHPEWLSQDYDGKDSYEDRQYLDQAIPGVIDYTVSVCTDLAKHYDVDGIHFDYIRYAEIMKDGGCAWGYNPLAIKRFNALYQKQGKPLPSDRDWTNFRRQQLADFLRKAYANVKAVKWDVKMSAATTTWGPLDDFKKSGPYVRTLQDWVGWMEQKLLDMNCLMNYQREHQEQYKKAYRDWARLGAKSKNGRFCLVGQGSYMNTVDNVIAQMLAARETEGIDGMLTYCYAENNSDKNVSRDAAFAAFRDKVFKERAAIPDAQWLSKPRTGIIMGYVAGGGVKFDGVAVTLGDKSVRTDATGFYAFLDLPVGDHTLSVQINGYEPQTQRAAVTPGKVSRLDFDLKKK
jgi:uncharacterized lipoprotein YddW (UPF0748 family)